MAIMLHKYSPIFMKIHWKIPMLIYHSKHGSILHIIHLLQLKNIEIVLYLLFLYVFLLFIIIIFIKIN